MKDNQVTQSAFNYLTIDEGLIAAARDKISEQPKPEIVEEENIIKEVEQKEEIIEPPVQAIGNNKVNSLMQSFLKLQKS